MPVAPILLVGGLACLVATALLLRSIGPRYRVGRLLAATPTVEIDDARAMALEAPTYVRVMGRISSDEEFPDEHDRPLVFRRKRIELGDGRGRWRTMTDEREAVPFGVETRSAFIAVDEAALDAGLVAIPREAGGRLSDLPADVLASLPSGSLPDTPARLLIEQLSAVEHATVCGTPVMRDGRPTLTAGTGRPLIVTTLEIPAAMRLLAAGHRRRVLAAAWLLFAGVGLTFGALLAFVVGA